jgi:hypothetical protein
MIGRKHQLARLQSDFYRDNYYKMLRGIMVSAVVIFLLIIAIIYYVLFTAPPQYYGTATSGQIIPMAPMQQ